MFTAQLICQGACRQVDIVRAFGVSKNSVIRSVNAYRTGGVEAFYAPRATRGASVMTPEVMAQAQQLLGAGWSPREVAEQLGLKLDTLRKAIQQGRLTEPVRLQPGESAPENAPVPQPPIATDKSTRAVEDAAAEMGTACTRPDERVLAAFGLLDGASTRFETCRDVSFGGVLCALPALAENGLFRHIHDCLAKLRGYYSTLHVIVLLAYMALCRIKAVEQLQYQPPGELGKLLGLDRVPEVRCLRRKLAALSIDDGPEKWAGLLSRDWLEAAPELAGALYVDGHVRLYHGNQTALPKRYVSRQRLCLRGTTDYWVNDVLGQPFFAVERPIDHGLLEVLQKRYRAASAQGCPRPADRGGTRGRPLSCTLRDPVRPRRVQPGVLQGDVADPPHRLHHLPQVSQGRLADRRVRGGRNDAAQRRASLAETGRARDVDRRPQERALGAGDPQADRPVGTRSA